MTDQVEDFIEDRSNPLAVFLRARRRWQTSRTMPAQFERIIDRQLEQRPPFLMIKVLGGRQRDWRPPMMGCRDIVFNRPK
jgi:hypothetical protein